jgi:flagellar assembly factor FliW
MPAVLVRSDRLGDLEVDEDKLLRFPDGLLGFPTATTFVMVAVDETEAYQWLQSVDDPALSFLCVIPWHFFPDYEPEVDPVTQQDLGLDDASDAIVLCFVTIRENEPTTVTANLLGPLVVNTLTRVGRQVVLAESGYPARAALVGA